jgi:hypothetical protein
MKQRLTAGPAGSKNGSSLITDINESPQKAQPSPPESLPKSLFYFIIAHMTRGFYAVARSKHHLP